MMKRFSITGFKNGEPEFMQDPEGAFMLSLQVLDEMNSLHNKGFDVQDDYRIINDNLVKARHIAYSYRKINAELTKLISNLN